MLAEKAKADKTAKLRKFIVERPQATDWTGLEEVKNTDE